MGLAGSILVQVGLCAMTMVIVSETAALQDAEETTGGGAEGCLRIEGPAIKRFVLRNTLGEITEITPHGDSVSLPVGSYEVVEIGLTGGFRGHSRFGPAERLEVAADQTPVLRVGLPLTSQVQVRRAGRLLALDYLLVDAQGRQYVGRGAGASPPTFTVFKNGRALGGGTFEYG